MARAEHRDPGVLAALLDAFWRAVGYCLHPRLILWSILPVVLVVVFSWALGFLFWDDAVALARHYTLGWSWMEPTWAWFERIGWASVRDWVAPLIVVALAIPLIVVACLLAVAVMVTPAIVSMVARRRFPDAPRERGASWWGSVGWSLGHTALALGLLLLSMPLWLVPPLVLILPPLIWGWLTYRVMAFDALAEHASVQERRALLRAHRWPLLGVGVLTGYLGAAPSLVWAVGALSLVLAPFLIALSIWVYTLVFIFSSAWITHYALAALQQQRHRAGAQVRPPGGGGPRPAGAPAAIQGPTAAARPPALPPAAPAPRPSHPPSPVE